MEIETIKQLMTTLKKIKGKLKFRSEGKYKRLDIVIKGWAFTVLYEDVYVPEHKFLFDGKLYSEKEFIEFIWQTGNFDYLCRNN